jgi:hypothetical protein
MPRHRLAWVCLAALVLPAALRAADGPPPATEKAVRFEELPRDPNARLGSNGYRVILTREAAEKLRDTLQQDVDEKKLAATISQMTTDLRGKVLAVLIAMNVSQFKKDMTDKMGPAGVVITVTGPKPSDLLKEPPDQADRRDEVIKGLLPRKLKGIFAAINTVPARWSIAPRETVPPPM